MITYNGIEWDYENLEGIDYSSETLLEPYGTWFYLITEAVNSEKEIIPLSLSDGGESSSIYTQKDKVIKVKDYYSKLFDSKEIENTFTVSDDSRYDVSYINDENLSVSESYVKKITKRFKESKIYFLDETEYKYKHEEDTDWTTVEQIDYGGATSLFDFEAKDGVWNEDQFKEWCIDSCPVNYNRVRPFYPGEYEYTNAYVGFKLTISPTKGRFGVANNVVYIDVEDTVEKGTAEALGGGLTEVTFSKRFYTTPHIMTSLLYSGENAYIVVSDVSRDGFKFGLKSATSGQYIAGEIDWLADGY